MRHKAVGGKRSFKEAFFKIALTSPPPCIFGDIWETFILPYFIWNKVAWCLDFSHSPQIFFKDIQAKADKILL